MPSRRGILGQVVNSNVTISIWTNLYTVPDAARDAVISCVTVLQWEFPTNISAIFRTAIVPAGGDPNTTKFLLHNGVSAPSNSTLTIMKGITLGVGDSIYVTSTTLSITFMAFGQENS